MTDLAYGGILPEPVIKNGFLPLEEPREAVFLLGTDVHIGEPDHCEQRVGITPDQLKHLKAWLVALNVVPRLFVVSGAGNGAGFSDEMYVEAGGEIIAEADLPQMAATPHVVHALKESTAYEATIPGPFIRIGALHSGDFRPGTGLAQMLSSLRYCGVFDGSAVGGFAFFTDFDVKPKFPIPLRSSMSVYAGKLAGEDVGKCLEKDEKVVVSGGGVAGTAAVGVLLDHHLDQLREVVIIEKFEERCRQLREMYAGYPLVTIKQGVSIEDEDIHDAKGLILTIFIQGSDLTPKVVDVSKLATMRRGGTIVDVAIDEGGGIGIPKDHELDPVTGRRPQIFPEDVRREIDALNLDLIYVADNHMPRRRPKLASVEHGETALMYLAVLLYLSALKGGDPTEAMKLVMDHDYFGSAKNILQALVLDLKHGLAFVNCDDTVVLYRHVLKKCDEFRHFFRDNGINAVFA